MILKRSKFKKWITQYNHHVPPKKTLSQKWDDYYLGGRYGRTMLNKPEKEISIDDAVIREMIDQIDFSLLYQSIDFRKALIKRLNFYGKK